MAESETSGLQLFDMAYANMYMFLPPQILDTVCLNLLGVIFLCFIYLVKSNKIFFLYRDASVDSKGRNCIKCSCIVLCIKFPKIKVCS